MLFHKGGMKFQMIAYFFPGMWDVSSGQVFLPNLTLKTTQQPVPADSWIRQTRKQRCQESN